AASREQGEAHPRGSTQLRGALPEQHPLRAFAQRGDGDDSGSGSGLDPSLETGFALTCGQVLRPAWKVLGGELARVQCFLSSNPFGRTLPRSWSVILLRAPILKCSSATRGCTLSGDTTSATGCGVMVCGCW